MIPRIVHVASGREWRGGQNQVRLLARALLPNPDIRQIVVTGRNGELARRLRVTGVPIEDCGWSAALDPRALLATLRAARGGAILHAHDGHALTIALAAARLRRLALVVTRRVDFHLRRPAPWLRAARVIAISDAVRRVLLEDGLRPERIAVVRSGIDPEEVRAAPTYRLREALGLEPGTPVAVNVAALVGHKDQATLLRAAALLRDEAPALHWVLAGEGPLRGALEDQVRHSGLGDRVHLLGQVSNPLGIIREADVFVMSSREEGLGTSILDAMALDVPVVATSAGGIPEILDGGAGRMVAIADAAALAREVALVIGRPGLAGELLETARRRLASFTDVRMAEAMAAVYRSVASTSDS